MKKLSTIVLAAGLALGACGKKDKEAPPAPAPAPAQGSGSAAADTDTGSGSAVAAGSADSAPTETPPPDEEPIDIATEMDYEDLANTEITEATLEARLKAIEAELAAQ